MKTPHKKRILFLTQVLPYPLDAGPKIRAYYVIRYLSRFYKITLISFVRPTDSQDSIDHLSQYCESIISVNINRSRFSDIIALIKSFLLRQPFLIIRDSSKNIIDAINNVLNDTYTSFEYIHADQLWMAKYALYAKRVAIRNHRSPITILDQHNAVFLIPQRMADKQNNPIFRWLLKLEATKLRRFEKAICKKFNHTVWVTKDDFHAIYYDNNSLVEKKSNSIIPICIDTNSATLPSPLSQEKNILFIGGMHWPPNAEGINWFVQEVLPIIQDTIPNTTIYIIGKSPPDYLQKRSNIIAPGYVDDLSPYWNKNKVFIVPIFSGGGMRVKILDAWAHGLPIISTSIGAEGIEYIDGKNILIADSPTKFAQNIVQILMNNNLANNLSKNGLEWVRSHYDWSKIYPQWDKVYK